MICYLFSEPSYFIFTSGVPALLYYAYIPTTLISLLMGFYVFWNNRQSLLNRIFFFITIIFSVWTIFDLIEWTNIHSSFILFVWNFQGIILGLLAIFCIYFIYVFCEQKEVTFRIKNIFLALLAPIFIFTPTVYLSGFDITTCDAFKFAWFPFEFYYTLLGVLAIFWILVLLIRKYRTSDSILRREIILMGTGIELFLFIFFIWTSFTYYLSEIGVLPDSSLEMYGMFGMIIFIIYISILIVRFKAFNGKLFLTQVLVWALIILIGSEFFYTQSNLDVVLTAVTLVISAWLGLSIVRSVKIEIEQKERLAELDAHLENLLKQRESLMHLVTHKVKGSFTRTKILFASMLDGTFGEITPEIRSRAQQGLDFDNGGIETVDLVLNAANMENGTLKYEMKPIDFKDIVEKTIAEKRIPAENKGLKLEETKIEDGNYGILGDAIWIKEAVNNLIENSIKYTREGSITVGLEKKPAGAQGEGDKLLFSVKDTGIGITDEDKLNLFKEGGRGKDSVKVNVDSTGYGLYTVKLVIEAHKGRVWAESEGAGKGSQFYIELPVAVV